jgi:ATP-binding cassette subfamily B protein
LLDPTEGQVLVGGMDVRHWPVGDLRRRIGFVPQETFLFSGTLRENVTFGVEPAEATESRVRAAVGLSRLENDLDQWPAGLEAVIGERGVTLSGGQKQRTAIARAVAREPSILILDDALSSVDTRTEAAVLTGLQEFMHHRTTLLIAHRFSTTRLADRIIVLEHGVIVEQGSHLELLEHGGLYARMYRRQLMAQELDLDDESVIAEVPYLPVDPHPTPHPPPPASEASYSSSSTRSLASSPRARSSRWRFAGSFSQRLTPEAWGRGR